MSKKLCINCMKGILDESGRCTVCGSRNEDIHTSSRHLPFYTILAGKYMIGRVLGEGGFGITYLGYDLNLEIPIAIKEFCPRDFAGREMTDGLTLSPFDEDCVVFYEEEKGKFIDEAKRLAKFRNEQCIVSVQDYFKENGTAYIVMEYIDGKPLKKFLKEMGHPMQTDNVLHLLRPIIKALQNVHKEGIIHRDISLDNIMLTNDCKQTYLIDFGTARMSDYAGERSLSVYKKGSYTPLEQQSRHGNQGPWTDVYALCATIYLCITGENIPEAIDRVTDDMLLPPSRYGIEIEPHVEEALMQGLAIKAEQRIRSMEELEKRLYTETVFTESMQTEQMTEPQPQPKEEKADAGFIHRQKKSFTYLEPYPEIYKMAQQAECLMSAASKDVVRNNADIAKYFVEAVNKLVFKLHHAYGIPYEKGRSVYQPIEELYRRGVIVKESMDNLEDICKDAFPITLAACRYKSGSAYQADTGKDDDARDAIDDMYIKFAIESYRIVTYYLAEDIVSEYKRKHKIKQTGKTNEKIIDLWEIKK